MIFFTDYRVIVLLCIISNVARTPAVVAETSDGFGVTICHEHTEGFVVSRLISDTGVPAERFIDLWAGAKSPENKNRIHAEWQLYFDRCFTRVIDNTKILELMGEAQSDLMPLYDGLKYELGRLDDSVRFPLPHIDAAMDNYLKEIEEK